MIKTPKKKRRNKEKYEDYWKITCEYTDIHGKKFKRALEVIVDFIDKNGKNKYSPELYVKLQKEVNKKLPKTAKDPMISARKTINQFVKLGFINYNLEGYHENSRGFIEARGRRRRRILFSEIVYEHSSFSRSVTKDSNKREINFLIKTLEEVGKEGLTKADILGLMRINKLSRFSAGYLTKEQLQEANEEAKKSKFLDRKYNQKGHFDSILRNLQDLRFVGGDLYFEEDARDVFGTELINGKRARDYYKHRLWKQHLIDESSDESNPKCMLDGKEKNNVVGSHIKPFKKSKPEEAYDENNGLLLCRNHDVLFDRGYITFKNNGEIMISDRMGQSQKKDLEQLSLKKDFLTPKRLEYMKYHRDEIFCILKT